jgi:hypothetical protein
LTLITVSPGSRRANGPGERDVPHAISHSPPEISHRPARSPARRRTDLDGRDRGEVRMVEIAPKYMNALGSSTHDDARGEGER